ncbi:flagellar biosynthetic protein FliQ [Thalassoglobus sp. JC818]|uniref:flagellar biosynthetic protein FliQ n=1 Tax=Thalassoglobus sp. JC818 TaxID=3232136 RepID=UPI00345A48C9
MNSLQIVSLSRDLLMTALLLSFPAVAVSLIVGTVISILQTVTSIQEQTLSFAPRIVTVALVMMVTLPWSLKIATGFTARVVSHMLETVQ